MRFSRSGQSLIDVLIASGIGAILLVGALSVLTPALRGSGDAEMAQTGATYARGLQDAVRSAASRDWNTVAGLSQGTSNRYHVRYDSAGAASFATGTESIAGTGSYTGLVGFWKFDEGSGTTSTNAAFPMASTSYAVLQNGATWGVAANCFSSACLYLDGVNDYAGAGLSTTTALSASEHTTTLWFRTSDSDGGLVQADNPRLGGTGWDRSVYLAGGNVCARNGAETICTTGTSYADNAWHQVAYVVGGSEGAQRLYVDGAEKVRGTVTAPSYAGATGITIGYSAHTSQYLQGYIDDVQVYANDITAPRVKLLAASRYSRSFYLEPVYRNSSGVVVTSGGYLDPSTLQLIVEYRWPTGGPRTITTYLTRSRSESTVQRDWTGGSGQDGPVVDPGNEYSTSSNITIDEGTGGFQIAL